MRSGTGTITSFGDDYSWLSNFFRCDVVLDGKVYHSVEHGFQAAKTTNLAERAKVRSLANRVFAKRAGKKQTPRRGSAATRDHTRRRATRSMVWPSMGDRLPSTRGRTTTRKGVIRMFKRPLAVSLLALVVACGGNEPGDSGGVGGGGGGGGGATYSVYFQIDGYNFDPTGGNMRVHATYYANGVGASGVVISSLPWSSSAVSNIPSGGNVSISGSLTSSYNCNGATVTVSVMANGQAVQSGTFACGATFSLHETLP